MPTLNLGQVRPVYRGAWNSIDTYVAYDFVIYNGSAYLALKDVPSNYEPPSQTESIGFSSVQKANLAHRVQTGQTGHRVSVDPLRHTAGMVLFCQYKTLTEHFPIRV